MRDSTGGVLAYVIERAPPVRIRLTRKFAACLNGLDLSRINVGDIVFLPERDAVMLIREGWAERVDA